MSGTTAKKNIYIDALALVPTKKSGIGYSLEQTLIQMSNLPNFNDTYHIHLVVPLGKAKYLKRYCNQGITTKTIGLPARGLEILARLNILPPIDWFIGRGIYIFPNYRNWPVWSSRSLTYVYDIGYILVPHTVQPKNRRYLQKYSKRWMARTDRVITITNQVKEEIEKNLDISYTKISVVYCGVDLTVFYRRSAKETTETKAKYNIPYDKYILFVGNIEPRKNLSTLLDAYEKLPTTVRDRYGLVIVGGDGWLNESFNERISTMRREGKQVLKIQKYVVTEDLPALYSGATALVHPAVYEGFGIPPLEAMACEIPTIVSDIPAIREVLQDNTTYFNPYNAQSLTDVLTSLLSDNNLHKTDIKKAKHHAMQLSWTESAKELAMIIEEESQRQITQPSPFVKHLKITYVRTDRLIRSILGEKTLQPYRPKTTDNVQELRTIVYNDFLKEQPSHAQSTLLEMYRACKLVAASTIRRIRNRV